MDKPYAKIRINLIAWLLLAVLFCPQVVSAIPDKIQENKNPKLANYYLKWLISDAETMELARYDLLVLDMEVQENSRQNLIKLRQLNPNIIILAYVASEEIRNDIINNRDAKLRRKLFAQINDSWWLRSDTANRLSSWQNTWLLNLTNQVQAVNGERWNTMLPKFVKDNIFSTGLWDGVFYDNVWHDISWINQGKIDINNDGLNETAAEINRQWVAGATNLLETSRNLLGNDYIIMSNGSSYDQYQPYLNGIMFENFPTPWEKNGRWQEIIQSYFRIKKLNREPKLIIINGNSKNEKDYFKMRNGLISSLLVGAYFSFDYDITDHSQTWWYDEYNYNLGFPLGEAYRVDGPSLDYPQGIWRRDFANGVIYLNSYYQQKRVDLPKRFKKLNGSQDGVVNDGGVVSYLILGPGDGIYLKNIFEIYDTALLNNVNYKIYNSNGDNLKDYIMANKYYKNFSRLSLNRSGQVKLTSKNNKMDINNDKKLERIDEINFGKESAVNIFNSQANKLIGSFFAYERKFKCGLRIALADIDGNGKIEIITLPAYGGPHLKIFDDRGRLKRQIFLGSKNLRANYDIVAADINEDKIPEILVASY